MFKKINNKLLSNYPLLWNTKVLLVLPAALIIHILFYLGGFLEPVQIKDLRQYRIFSDVGVTTFSVLVSLLIIILWLVYYLRNNPFKSFYTLGRNYMFAEFFIIFLIFFSTSTFFLTYKQGYYDNIKRMTAGNDLRKEVDLVNLAHHFIAYDYTDFNLENSCNPDDTLGPKSYSNSSSDDVVIYDKDGGMRFPENAEQNLKVTALPSYFYHCKLQVELYNYSKDKSSALGLVNEWEQTSPAELDKTAVRWLKEGKKDSVFNVLSDFKALLEKYNITNNFKPADQVKECFSDEKSSVNKLVVKDIEIDDNSRLTFTYQYIKIDDLQRTLQSVLNVQTGFWNIYMLIAIIYYALGAAIVLFSFRLTRTRAWFMALIGTGLWAILLSLIGVMVHAGKNYPVLFIIIWVLMIIVGLLFIYDKQNKSFAGVLFNWIFWFCGWVLPIIVGLIYIGDRSATALLRDDEDSISKWINGHWPTINGVNMLFIVAMVYLFFIPLARRWQSNPEE